MLHRALLCRGKAVKRAGLLVSAAAAFCAVTVSGLAAMGLLADEKQVRIGAVSPLVPRCAEQNPLLTDGSGILFSALGESVEVMYRYDPASDSAEPVCGNILCDHQSRRCPLYRLRQYLGDMNLGSMNWFAAENAVLYAVRNEETVTLRRWDTNENSDRFLYEFPVYIVQTDALGIEYKTQSGIFAAAQLDADLWFVHCCDKGYLFDSDMNLRFTFPVEPAYYRYTWTDNALYWSANGRLRQCNLQTGKVRTCAETEIPVCVSVYAAADAVYCQTETQIVRYEPETDGITPIAETEPYTESALVSGKLYFCRGGIICRMIPETGETESLPALKALPVGVFQGRLVISYPENNAARIRLTAVES